MNEKEFVECHYCGGKLGYFPDKPWEGKAFKELEKDYFSCGYLDISMSKIIDALQEDYYAGVKTK